MPEHFVSTEQLAPSYLNANAALGLFKPLGHNAPADLFWVLDHDGGRQAVALGGPQDMYFPSWSMSTDEFAYLGLSLGPVTLEVNTLSASNERVGAGSIVIHRGSAWVIVSIRQLKTIAIEVGKCGSGPDERAVHFPSWRLVQFDRRGKPIELYRRDLP